MKLILTVEGHAALKDFALDPAILHLNNGSYGATPRTVLAEQELWRVRMEKNPVRFLTDDLPGRLRAGAAEVAARFGGDADGWVFVENATSAVNAILNSIRFRAGDVLVTTSHAYDAVLKAMRRRTGECGAEIRIAKLPAAPESQDQTVEAIENALCERTRLLIADHITSPTAVIFPAAGIVASAHARNVPVLIDGAHVPGQLALNAAAIGADWYTGNAHKWLFAPKGCGILWTAPAHREETHPCVTSHGWGAGYTAEFDWTGTRDPSPWLCFGVAAKAHDGFGGAGLMARNRALAKEAGDILSGRLHATPAANPAMQCAMTALLLAPHGTPEEALMLRRRLAREHGIEVPVFVFDGALWLRISAQIYNEKGDYERLAQSLGQLLDQ